MPGTPRQMAIFAGVPVPVARRHSATGHCQCCRYTSRWLTMRETYPAGVDSNVALPA